MIERVTEDRRNKKLDVETDHREIRRRAEDKANIKSYYGVLGLCIGTLLLFGTISFIWGR
ncbi:MAG: hypothetical protein GY793_04310 [Proteobacteria bacterium]|nr:hypothetical protein [Pseudomonadota bacterium]